MKIKFWGYAGEKTPDNEEAGVLGRRYKKECYHGYVIIKLYQEENDPSWYKSRKIV